jgi:hypothetical protein
MTAGSANIQSAAPVSRKMRRRLQQFLDLFFLLLHLTSGLHSTCIARPLAAANHRRTTIGKDCDTTSLNRSICSTL